MYEHIYITVCNCMYIYAYTYKKEILKLKSTMPEMKNTLV